MGFPFVWDDMMERKEEQTELKGVFENETVARDHNLGRVDEGTERV